MRMQCYIVSRGVIQYQEGVRIQKEFFDSVDSGINESAIILCQHSPVITLGRRALDNNILFPPEYLFRKKIEVVDTDRGGDVTYHGPGQLIAYPVFPLRKMGKDLHQYLRCLEEVIIIFLRSYGLEGNRRLGLTGVWAKDRKIASIGISVRRWISFHGFSLNIEHRSLDGYRFIRPCGMDVAMTALESQRDGIHVEDCLESLLDAFRQVFKVTLIQEEALAWQK